MGGRDKINAITLNVEINKRKLVHICGYKLAKNEQNFMQKDSAQAKISKVVGGLLSFDSPCIHIIIIIIVITDSKTVAALLQPCVGQYTSIDFLQLESTEIAQTSAILTECSRKS